ncbi:hypothetical protein [Sporomusa sp. KB1]|jgi:hypothetical protein|uniref:hypothetical protein n=1 Tax=Sporomusa sp. KB1 TaxID=943346 RepID=UPI001C989C0B|nr:hypothetical protein [Sporomusa sp. KB1]
MHWPDGRKFEIDKILDVRMAPSQIGGGHGMSIAVGSGISRLICFMMIFFGALKRPRHWPEKIY